ncbi:MAG TPA: hypothetical protein VHX88_09200 [Solirubrobacteraceae bacterium]|jgi:hypothetical protein|nr:hypothetical protein [Solirubrobacteraceae bacterium]
MPTTPIRHAALVAAVAAGLYAAGSAAASTTALRPCPPGSYPGLGYFTSLEVSGTTCRVGRRLELAYYACRIAHGGPAGRCNERLDGFRCQEIRRSIPTEVDAIVTCRKGHERVTHSYQQDLQ